MLMSSRSLLIPPALLAPLLRSAPSAPPLSWRRTEEGFTLDVFAAGLAPSDLSVRQEERTLTITLGQRGSITARIPSAADASTLSATLARGVLTLSLGVLQSSLPRTIEIKEVSEKEEVSPQA